MMDMTSPKISRKTLVVLVLSTSVLVKTASAYYDDYDVYVQAAGDPSPSEESPVPLPAEAFANGTWNSTDNGTYPAPEPAAAPTFEEWTSNSTLPFVNETNFIGNDTENGNSTSGGWVNVDIDVPLNGTSGWNSTWTNETATLNDTLAVPISAPFPSPAPNLTPIPEPEGSPSTPTPNPPEPCTGVVYDGYLHGCVIYLDINGNKRRDDGDSFGISYNGMFSVDVPQSNLTDTAIFRMEPATARGPVSPGADTCHDISTLMPERLPLAAKAPESCGPDSKPLVLSPLSTLATLLSESILEDVFELPAGLLGSDVLRLALDGDQNALRVMRREVQVKNLVSMVSSAVTNNQSAYSRIARAAFKQLGDLVAGPSSESQPTAEEPFNGSPSTPGVSSRRMLLQSPSTTTTQSAQALTLATLFQGMYATLAADSDIDLSDIAFISNETILAVATSIANFNDLSDSLANNVQDVYRMALLMESQLLPAIQALVAGNTTAQEFTQSNSLDKMILSFEQTSLPEGSTPDPLLVPSPPLETTAGTPQSNAGHSSSLSMGLGLGLGLGIPMIAITSAAVYMYSKRQAATRRRSAGPFVSTTGISPAKLPKTASPSTVAEIAASAGQGSRSPLGHVL